jgi:predicted nuclease of predicted toxin-antitoxin system
VKILFDQNLSPKLVAALSDVFPGSAHVRDFQMREAEDWEVWNFAVVNGFAIATKDGDFRQRSIVQGHPPKIILLAIGNCPSARVEQLIRSRLSDLAAFDSDPQAALIVLS